MRMTTYLGTVGGARSLGQLNNSKAKAANRKRRGEKKREKAQAAALVDLAAVWGRR